MSNCITMEKEKILSADILDIIFDGRNKEYGAYSLRKQYDKRMWKAIGGMIAFLLISFSLIQFFKEKDLMLTKAFIISENELVRVMVPEKPKAVIPIHKITAGSTQGRSSKIKMVKEAGIINALINAGTPTKDSSNLHVGFGKGPVGPPIEKPIAGTIQPIINDDPFVSRLVNASFPGGDLAWKKYLEKYLDKETAVNNNAPVGEYRVIVRFMVNTEGKISEVQAETDFGYGMEAEAIRVIKRGPNWVPAQQNLEKLNVYRRQPITFIVSE